MDGGGGISEHRTRLSPPIYLPKIFYFLLYNLIEHSADDTFFSRVYTRFYAAARTEGRINVSNNTIILRNDERTVGGVHFHETSQDERRNSNQTNARFLCEIGSRKQTEEQNEITFVFFFLNKRITISSNFY